MAVGFGLMFGGEGERAKMRVLVDDQDHSTASQAFVAGLLALDSVSMERAERSAAAEQVKRGRAVRSEEHTSELQSLMRISYAVFGLKKKKHASPLRYLLKATDLSRNRSCT